MISRRHDRSWDSTALISSRGNLLAISLLEQDLRHHSLVLVVQQMTMKQRHAFDRWVGEVQNNVNGAAGRNIHGIEPCGRVDRRAILCIGQKMHPGVCGKDAVRDFD